jgi:hypothetical protein
VCSSFLFYEIDFAKSKNLGMTTASNSGNEQGL